MTALDLLTEDELPEDFRYPAPFNRVVAFSLIRLEPWLFLEGVPLREKFYGLAERYGKIRLVPFAVRVDNDDVACFEAGRGDAVFLIHDYASPGWELRAEFPTFFDWFRQAVEDFIAISD